MTSEGIHPLVIKNARSATIGPILFPEGDIVRIYDHRPTSELRWWTASVPLTRGSLNRRVEVLALKYDVEMSRTDFLDALDDQSLVAFAHADPDPIIRIQTYHERRVSNGEGHGHSRHVEGLERPV